MELRIWLLLVLVLLAMLAVLCTGAAVVLLRRRVRRLESTVTWEDERLYDLSQSLSAEAKRRYDARRAARSALRDIADGE